MLTVSAGLADNPNESTGSRTVSHPDPKTASPAGIDYEVPTAEELIRQFQHSAAQRNQKLKRFSVRVAGSTRKTHAQLTESLEPLKTPLESIWEGRLFVDGNRLRSEKLFPETDGRRTGTIAIRNVNLHAAWNSDDDVLTIADDSERNRSHRLSLSRHGNPDPRELPALSFAFEPNIRVQRDTLESTRCLRMEEIRAARRRVVHFIDPARGYVLLRQEIHFTPSNMQSHDFDWAFDRALDCQVLVSHTWTARGPEQDGRKSVIGLEQTVRFTDYSAKTAPAEVFTLDHLRKRPGRVIDHRVKDENKGHEVLTKSPPARTI